ncbi:uncharacterized protein LOC132386265, partial [Hypanus sabinus]|uniref:uncharacterized protein LOC132386265 n=1 Tax=Hypanus sabinus TaxID=79690 RepID=UPI0028C3B56F
MDDRETYTIIQLVKPDSPSPSRAAQLEIVCVALMHMSAQASSVNGSFPSLSSETQRILDRMDDSGAFKNVKFTETDSPSPSGDEPDVSYVELHFKTLSVPRVRTNGDSLTSTYSELKFRKDEPLIDEGLAPPIASGPGELLITAQTDSQHNFRKVEPLINEDEDPPISPGPGGMPTAAQTAAQEKERKVKIGNRPYRVICLLCLVTSALIVTVVGLSIHVSQIRQSKVTSDRNYHELNSTLQSELSALNSNLSDLKR